MPVLMQEMKHNRNLPLVLNFVRDSQMLASLWTGSGTCSLHPDQRVTCQMSRLWTLEHSLASDSESEIFIKFSAC
jgi:hypothetical protein